MATLGNRRQGDQFGPFTLCELIGTGTTTSVHRATQVDVAGRLRVLAIKRLLPHLARNASIVEAFVDEANVGMKLGHPNIIQVYEHGRIDNEYFMLMEYVDGYPLTKILQWARLTAKSSSTQIAVTLLVRLCRALEHLNSAADESGDWPKGILSGIRAEDVIVCTSGEPMIADLKTVLGHRPLQSRHIYGAGRRRTTPEYLKKEPENGQAGVWSLGLIAHELVTTTPNTPPDDAFAKTPSPQDETIPDGNGGNGECPPELLAIILRALEPAPEDRWQGPGDMAKALESLAEEKGITISPSGVADWISLLISSLPPREFEEGDDERRPRLEQRTSDRDSPPVSWSREPKPSPVPGGVQGPTLAKMPSTAAETFDTAPPEAVPIPIPQDRTEARLWTPSPLTSELDLAAQRTWPSGTTSPPLVADEATVRTPWWDYMKGFLLFAIGSIILTVGVIVYKLATPAMPRPLTTGSLEVVTVPATAAVWIDGEETRTISEMEAGTHHVRAELDDYVPWAESIVTRPGANLKIIVALAPAEQAPIVVHSIPDASAELVVMATEASKMRRLGGSELRLRSARRSGRRRVRALLCVSQDGAVTSSQILSNISKRSKRLLQAQLATWRYRPVKVVGKGAVSACFFDSLRVD